MPPAPVVTVREIRDTKVSLYWQIPAPPAARDAPMTLVARHLIEIEGSPREEVDRQETSVVITELEPDTRYRVRVWVVGADQKWKTPSEWVVIKTTKTIEKKSTDGVLHKTGVGRAEAEGSATHGIALVTSLSSTSSASTSAVAAAVAAAGEVKNTFEPMSSSSSSTVSSLSSSSSPAPTTTSSPSPSNPISPITATNLPSPASTTGVTDAELALVRAELAKIRTQREDILQQISDLEQHHKQQESSLREELARLREMKRSDVEEPRTRLKARVKQLEDARREAEAARARAEKEAAREETTRKRIEEQVVAREREVEAARRAIRVGEEAAEETAKAVLEQKERTEHGIGLREAEVAEARRRLEEVEKEQAGIKKELEGRRAELEGVRARNKELEAEMGKWEERGRERERERAGNRERFEGLERENRELTERLRMETREKMKTMEELGRFKKWKEDQELERRTGIGVMNTMLNGVRRASVGGGVGGGGRRTNTEGGAGGNQAAGGTASSLSSSVYPDRKSRQIFASPAELYFPIVNFPAQLSSDTGSDMAVPPLSPSSSANTASSGSSRRASVTQLSTTSPVILRRKGPTSPPPGFGTSPPSPPSPLPDLSPGQRASTSPVASLNGVPVLRPAPSGNKRHMLKGASSATLLDPAPGPPKFVSRARSSSFTDSGYFEQGSPSPPYRGSGTWQRQHSGPLMPQQPGSPPFPSTHPFNHPNGGHHLHHKASSSLFEHDPLGDTAPNSPVAVVGTGRARSSSNPVSPLVSRFEIPPNPILNPVHRSASSGSAMQRPSSKLGVDPSGTHPRNGRRQVPEYSLYSSPMSADGGPAGIVSFVPPWIIERTRSASLPGITALDDGSPSLSPFGFQSDGYANFGGPGTSSSSYWSSFPRDRDHERDRDRHLRSLMSGLLDEGERLGEDNVTFDHSFVPQGPAMVNGPKAADSGSTSSTSPGSPMSSSAATTSGSLAPAYEWDTDTFSTFYHPLSNHQVTFSPGGKKRAGVDSAQAHAQSRPQSPPVSRFSPFGWEESTGTGTGGGGQVEEGWTVIGGGGKKEEKARIGVTEGENRGRGEDQA